MSVNKTRVSGEPTATLSSLVHAWCFDYLNSIPQVHLLLKPGLRTHGDWSDRRDPGWDRSPPLLGLSADTSNPWWSGGPLVRGDAALLLLDPGLGFGQQDENNDGLD